MARFIIQTRPPGPAKSDLDIQIAPVGFCWAAFFFGPLWLINQGAWAAAIADAGFVLLIDLLADMIRPELWPLLASLFLAERAFIGFEAYDALRAHWTAKGFGQRFIALGQDEEEALARWLAGQQSVAVSKPAPTTPKTSAPKTASGPVGLFPLGGLMGKLAQTKSQLGLKR